MALSWLPAKGKMADREGSNLVVWSSAASIQRGGSSHTGGSHSSRGEEGAEEGAEERRRWRAMGCTAAGASPHSNHLCLSMIRPR